MYQNSFWSLVRSQYDFCLIHWTIMKVANNVLYLFFEFLKDSKKVLFWPIEELFYEIEKQKFKLYK